MNEKALTTYCSNAYGGYDNWNNSICCEVFAFENKPENDRHFSFGEIMSSPVIRNLQRNLLSGIKDPVCKTCWDHESHGIKSLRQFSTFINDTPPDINHEITNQKIRRLVINSGVVCNLSCRTCSPYLSSSWWKEYESRNLFYMRDVRKTNVDKLLEEDYSELKTIMILGGEPFLNLDHVRVLEKIIADGNAKNCHLNYTSNFTLPIPEQIKKVADKFHTTFFTMSIDAVGDQFKYIRTNGDWSRVLKNINEVQKTNYRLNINSVVSILNIMYLDDLIAFQKSLDLPIHFVFCSNPAYYSPEILTPIEKDKIIDIICSQNLPYEESLINYIKSYDFNQDTRSKFWEEVEFTRKYHDLDINEYLPKLIEILL